MISHLIKGRSNVSHQLDMKWRQFFSIRSRERSLQQHITKEKRRGELVKCVFMLHDSAPVRKALVAMYVMMSCSPDLAPRDFMLFTNLKKSFRGRYCQDEIKL